MVQFMDNAEPPAVPAASAASGRTPWHLWVVGVISLLWNLVGATDYTMSQLRNPTWMEAGAEQMGVTASQMIAYIDGFPVWMHGFWALGVWGAVAGSVLLLMRSRLAVWSFGASLLGLAATQFYRALAPQPEWARGDVAFNLVLWSIATFLLIYAVSMRNKGVIR